MSPRRSDNADIDPPRSHREGLNIDGKEDSLLDNSAVAPDVFRELFDACWQARKITDLLPELPEGMRPRHITVLDAVHIIGNVSPVRVGEISEFLHVSKPGVTKMINELTDMGYLSKDTSKSDGRGVEIALTPLGRTCRNTYAQEYRERICQALAGKVSDQDCRVTTATITLLLEAVASDSSAHRRQ